MALLNLIIASLTAFLTSFLSLSPGAFHGLGPWTSTLSNGPVVPTPSSASPKAFFFSDLWEWEEIPIVGLPTTDFTTPPPTATFSLLLDEEEDDEPLTVPLVEEPTTKEHPTAEELLQELWWLLWKSILLLGLNLNDFFVGNPCLDWFFSRGHSQPGSLTQHASASASELSTEKTRTPPVVVDTVEREQQNRICELEKEVKNLTAQIQEMQRRELPPVPSAPAAALPTPQPPRFSRGQPVFSTGSAPPQPPLQHFGSAYCHGPQHTPSQPNWVPTGAAGSSKNQSILYDAKVKPVSNKPEVMHYKFIQRLHADGISKEEIHRRTLDEFPDLCGGGTDKARKARVWNAVDMNTSRWADKYI